MADTILATMERWLWDESLGHYVAHNVSSSQPILNRVFLMALPLWGGAAPAHHAAQIAVNILRSDMISEWGLRSTSSADDRYSNANIINPYSNWRGPIWVNVNAAILYGMVSPDYKAVAPQLAKQAVAVARAVTGALAQDLRANGTWHECFSSETGEGLAAPGFLSWDTLGASLLPDIKAQRDPFEL